MNRTLTISKAQAYSYLIILALTGISIGVISATTNIVMHILMMWFFAFTAILISNVDIMHPYTWFSLILTLYSTAYAILISMGLAGNYSYKQLLYPAIALGVSLVFIGPEKRKKNDVHFLSEPNADETNYKYLDINICVLFVISIVLSLLLLRSGFSGKTEMKRANNVFYRIGVYSVRYLTLFTIIRVGNRIRLNMNYVWCFVLSGIATLAFSLSTGERDVFIRFFVVVLFILYSSGKIKKRHFILLVPISMVVLTLSVEFKYYFLRGTLNGSFSMGNLVESFLSSDFSAAGRNLQYLIERPWTEGYFGIGMFFTELLYPILPSSITTNPDYWFNNVVHAGGYQGNAFTLVGTGYIIAGVLGVIILFATVGCIIKWLYRNSEKNIYYYSTYIYSITIVMISLRGSLNSIINCLLKEVLVCFVFCYVANRILSEGNRAR